MKRNTPYIFFSIIAGLIQIAPCTALMPSPTSTFLGSSLTEPPHTITIQNKPLVKINGKVFSVMDVKKKMDIFIRENHPDAASSPIACYQFYAQRWRSTLQDMINAELMKMEAEELKIPVVDGDIREELENRFGPNIFKRLDDLGITYDEAKEMIRDEIIVRNLSWYRIWARAFQAVTPEALKNAYSTYVEHTPGKEEWVYETLSIRGRNQEDCQMVATYLQELLEGESLSLADVTKKVEDALPEGVHITLSNEFRLDNTVLAPAHRSILEKIPLNAFSAPVQQTSRLDQGNVLRIFHLKDHIQTNPPTFSELSTQLKNQLLQQEGDKSANIYYARLRKHFYCEDLVVDKLFDAQYQPFSMR